MYKRGASASRVPDWDWSFTMMHAPLFNRREPANFKHIEKALLDESFNSRVNEIMERASKVWWVYFTLDQGWTENENPSIKMIHELYDKPYQELRISIPNQELLDHATNLLDPDLRILCDGTIGMLFTEPSENLIRLVEASHPTSPLFGSGGPPAVVVIPRCLERLADIDISHIGDLSEYLEDMSQMYINEILSDVVASNSDKLKVQPRTEHISFGEAFYPSIALDPASI